LVRVAGRTDVDQVNVIALHNPPPVGLVFFPAERAGGLPDRVFVASADDFHHRLDGSVEEARDLPPGVAVGASHKLITDHRNVDLLFHRSIQIVRNWAQAGLIPVWRLLATEVTENTEKSLLPLCPLCALWLLIHMKNAVETLIYHPICNMNRKVLPSFSVLVIAPKFGFANSNPGSANWGVLKRLIDSARKVSRKSFLNPHERWSEALTLRIGPLRKTLRPRFRRGVVGLMN